MRFMTGERSITAISITTTNITTKHRCSYCHSNDYCHHRCDSNFYCTATNITTVVLIISATACFTAISITAMNITTDHRCDILTLLL
mmetsp:Transcript_15481/g.22722  ORF Transcript_15481/g.22722 Transcript_15481/m.22722 type:complete len:87 (-) Transcript_15481:164-424(-)